MSDEILLNEAAYAVWQSVKDRGPIELDEVANITGINQAQVSATATEARERGYFEVTEREREELLASEGWKKVFESPLPERLAVGILGHAGGQMPMGMFAKEASSAGVAVNDAIKWGILRNWIAREKTAEGATLVLTDAGRLVFNNNADPDVDYLALSQLDNRQQLFLDELEGEADKRAHCSAIAPN